MPAQRSVRKRPLLYAIFAVLLAGCGVAPGGVGQPSPPPTEAPIHIQAVAQATPTQPPWCIPFPETGKEVCDDFRSFWEAYGGMVRHGPAISDPFYEVAEDGNTYLSQYFRYSLLRHYPDPPNSSPRYDVRLQPLGRTIYDRRYPGGASKQEQNTDPNGILFGMPGPRLGGPFLRHWVTPVMNKQLDGGETYGIPISDEFMERDPATGEEYRVQYFENAAFRYNPGVPPPGDVALLPLGEIDFQEKYGGKEPNNATPTPRPYGTPAPGYGCWRDATTEPAKGRPKFTKEQVEAFVRQNYVAVGHPGRITELQVSEYILVDPGGPDDHRGLKVEAWRLSFKHEPLGYTPSPTPIPGQLDWGPWYGYRAYVDGKTGQLLPGCEKFSMAIP
jgi:hypothetical protein